MRFVHANTLGDRSSVNKVKPVGPARPSTNATKSVPVHTVSSVAQKTTASKVYPKSLSVVDMLKLGKKSNSPALRSTYLNLAYLI